MNVKPISVTISGKETLLSKFIEQKVSEYVAPKKKRVPKGEVKGYPLKKYAASLVVGLMNLPLKEVPKKMPVSLNSLYKWNTEKAFKDLLQKHRSEYTPIVFDYLGKETLKHKSNKSHTLYPQLRDFALYSDILKSQILGTFSQVIREIDFDMETYMPLMLFFLPLIDKEAARSFLDTFQKTIILVTVEGTLSYIESKRKTEDERKKVISNLTNIQKMMKEDLLNLDESD